MIIDIYTNTDSRQPRPAYTIDATYATYGFTYDVRPRKLREFHIRASNDPGQCCILILDAKEARNLHDELTHALNLTKPNSIETTDTLKGPRS